MAARKEVLEVSGREVSVTNPDKVFFPQIGRTKLDLVRYYLAVADGALRGAGGRPMALKRYVNGAEELDLSEIQDVVLSMEYEITPGGP